MKSPITRSRVLPIAFAVLGLVFLGLSFLFRDNFILLAVGLTCLTLNAISSFLAQPKSGRSESLLFSGIWITLMVVLAAAIGYVKASHIVF